MFHAFKNFCVGSSISVSISVRGRYRYHFNDFKADFTTKIGVKYILVKNPNLYNKRLSLGGILSSECGRFYAKNAIGTF